MKDNWKPKDDPVDRLKAESSNNRRGTSFLSFYILIRKDFLRLFIENTGYLLPQSGDTMWTLLFLAVNRKLSNRFSRLDDF